MDGWMELGYYRKIVLPNQSARPSLDVILYNRRRLVETLVQAPHLPKEVQTPHPPREVQTPHLPRLVANSSPPKRGANPAPLKRGANRAPPK